MPPRAPPYDDDADAAPPPPADAEPPMQPLDAYDELMANLREQILHTTAANFVATQNIAELARRLPANEKLAGL